jgi:hypothetical protein
MRASTSKCWPTTAPAIPDRPAAERGRGSEAVVGVLAKPLGRQAGEGRPHVRIAETDRRPHPYHRCAGRSFGHKWLAPPVHCCPRMISGRAESERRRFIRYAGAQWSALIRGRVEAVGALQ